MIIVGELINASRKAVAGAIEEQDGASIAALAKHQQEAGAQYIDLNAGVFVDCEGKYLKWLVQTTQEATGARCCIDSPDPKAIEAALSVHKGEAMINSISLEKERRDTLLPIVAGTGVNVVALCMSDQGMPRTADERLHIADQLITMLTRSGIAMSSIFVDPLVQPVATDSSFGMEFLIAVERIMTGFPGVHTICGLSNVSYGLPQRKLLNRTFMAMAVERGLDAAIVNPLDGKMMAAIFSAEALTGRDESCINYIRAFRQKKLDN